MLPGFRFLFAAIILSMSVLVFGLGAAALLRAAHEEFASTPPWHAAPEASFAQQREAAAPVLALLRVEPSVAGKTSEPGPASTAPQMATAEPASVSAEPAEPTRTAALPPEDSSPSETARLQIAVAEAPPPAEALAAPAEMPAPAGDSKIATPDVATEPAPPAASAPALQAADAAAPTASEPASVPAAADTDIVSTTIATLGGPPVAIEQPRQASHANPEPNIVRKRQKAQRAIKRRRIASRAWVAAQAPDPLANPFAPPVNPVRSR